MSNDAITWAREAGRGLPSSEKFILFILADRSQDGRAWPSIRSIMDDTGMAERTVQRQITSLIERGIVRAERSGGRGMATVFFLQDDYRPEVKGAIHDRNHDDERVPIATERVPKPTERVPTTTEKGAKNDAPTIREPIEPSNNHQTGGRVVLALFGGDMLPSAPSPAVSNEAAFQEFWDLYPHRLSGGKMVKPDNPKLSTSPPSTSLRYLVVPFW